MRIAQIAPLAESVPPKLYGGTERVVAWLVDELVSLGHEFGGLFSPDEELVTQLLSAAEASGDKLWRMPLAEPFDRMIDSPIADMKNVGPREGGSITAAEFIKRFIDDGVRWAHLDIAGMAWSDKAGTTHEKGATGFGVRLLDQLVADTVEG